MVAPSHAYKINSVLPSYIGNVIYKDYIRTYKRYLLCNISTYVVDNHYLNTCEKTSFI